MSAAKATALEAANAELSNEVKQLKAQLEKTRADAKAQMAAAAAGAAQSAGLQHASSQRPPTASTAAAARCVSSLSPLISAQTRVRGRCKGAACGGADSPAVVKDNVLCDNVLCDLAGWSTDARAVAAPALLP